MGGYEAINSALMKTTIENKCGRTNGQIFNIGYTEISPSIHELAKKHHKYAEGLANQRRGQVLEGRELVIN